MIRASSFALIVSLLFVVPAFAQEASPAMPMTTDDVMDLIGMSSAEIPPTASGFSIPAPT